MNSILIIIINMADTNINKNSKNQFWGYKS